jgi:AcrR family transcriptional regulator
MPGIVAALPKIRRTQGERSASTRSRLLDATIDSLAELGYAGTTTTVIAERAGVSRGAQLHHFPTKAELVTTAVEHLFQRRNQEFRTAMAKLPPAVDRAEAAVDLLWAIFSGPTFYAWLELVVAGRTDAALKETLRGIAERFGEEVERTFRDVFATSEAPGPFYAIAPWFTFAILQGLAMDRIVDGEDARLAGVLQALKAISKLVFSTDYSNGRTSP